MVSDVSVHGHLACHFGLEVRPNVVASVGNQGFSTWPLEDILDPNHNSAKMKLGNSIPLLC
jgi:hypothetical protein